MTGHDGPEYPIEEGCNEFSAILPHVSNWGRCGLLSVSDLPNWLDFAFGHELNPDAAEWLTKLTDNRISLSELVSVFGGNSGFLPPQKFEGVDGVIYEAFFGCEALQVDDAMSRSVDLRAVFAWLFRERIFAGVDVVDAPRS